MEKLICKVCGAVKWEDWNDFPLTRIRCDKCNSSAFGLITTIYYSDDEYKKEIDDPEA